jgi:hypothetical protein
MTRQVWVRVFAGLVVAAFLAGGAATHEVRARAHVRSTLSRSRPRRSDASEDDSVPVLTFVGASVVSVERLAPVVPTDTLRSTPILVSISDAALDAHMDLKFGGGRVSRITGGAAARLFWSVSLRAPPASNRIEVDVLADGARSSSIGDAAPNAPPVGVAPDAQHDRRAAPRSTRSFASAVRCPGATQSATVVNGIVARSTCSMRPSRVTCISLGLPSAFADDAGRCSDDRWHSARLRSVPSSDRYGSVAIPVAFARADVDIEEESL